MWVEILSLIEMSVAVACGRFLAVLTLDGRLCYMVDRGLSLAACYSLTLSTSQLESRAIGFSTCALLSLPISVRTFLGRGC